MQRLSRACTSRESLNEFYGGTNGTRNQQFFHPQPSRPTHPIADAISSHSARV